MSLFQSIVETWVNPEVERRREEGTWLEGRRVGRFQVQFLDDHETTTRLNEEVQGILTVKATGPIEKGQAITAADFSEISGYQLPDQHAHHPHVTGFSHNGMWFFTFQLGRRDPARHEVLAAAREFLAAAHAALEAGRLRVCLDAANSAVELLAKAELLSCAPTIEIAQKAASHRTLSQAYNVWAGRLGNSDRRFSDALNRLAALRRQARYLTAELDGDEAEAIELIAVLDDMEKHVAHLVKAPMHELPDQFTVMAARQIKAGELVGPDATTLFPSKRS